MPVSLENERRKGGGRKGGGGKDGRDDEGNDSAREDDDEEEGEEEEGEEEEEEDQCDSGISMSESPFVAPHERQSPSHENSCFVLPPPLTSSSQMLRQYPVVPLTLPQPCFPSPPQTLPPAVQPFHFLCPSTLPTPDPPFLPAQNPPSPPPSPPPSYASSNSAFLSGEEPQHDELVLGPHAQVPGPHAQVPGPQVPTNDDSTSDEEEGNDGPVHFPYLAEPRSDSM